MKSLGRVYWVVTLAWFAAAMWWVLGDRTPVLVDANGAQLWQKIFYFHMPVAVCALLACVVVLVASVGFLAQRKSWWDDLANSAAVVAVVLCTIVLATGMIWGRGAWGAWWTWRSPKLVFSLMLWLLYVVYLVIRSSIEGDQRRAVVAAVYGIVASLDVPLVWLSARMIPDENHPIATSLSPERKLALALSFVPVILAAAGLIYGQYVLNRKNRAWRDTMREQAAEPAGGVA